MTGDTTMMNSKARWAKTATKLALTTAMSAFWMAATPAAAAAVDQASAARASALRDCSWMSDDDWSYAYRACMAQHGQQE
jgi:hypothetical protein